MHIYSCARAACSHRGCGPGRVLPLSRYPQGPEPPQGFLGPPSFESTPGLNPNMSASGRDVAGIWSRKARPDGAPAELPAPLPLRHGKPRSGSRHSVPVSGTIQPLGQTDFLQPPSGQSSASWTGLVNRKWREAPIRGFVPGVESRHGVHPDLRGSEIHRLDRAPGLRGRGRAGCGASWKRLKRSGMNCGQAARPGQSARAEWQRPCCEKRDSLVRVRRNSP